MSAGAEVLLKKKVYYGNCPGCKQDLRNEEHPGIPYREFVYIWIVTICSALPLCSLYPFLYFMVRDLHIAKRAEDIGFYAGFVGAAFMFGRTLTSVFWGVVADRYGRKPVIMISIVSTIIFNTLFGLSTTFWMAVATRGLLGFFSGLLGPIKAYASEVCRKEHQALGLSLVSTSRGIGLIVGPAIGGLLAQPAEKYPNIFSEKSLFGRFPYFLPCLCISIIAVLAFIACFWLPETLHFHGEHELNDGAADELEAIEKCHLINNAEETERSPSAPKKSLLKNWPLMSAITIYCIFSFNDTAYSEIFSLWAESNVQYGGLSFSSQDVGEVLALTGLGLFLFQLFGYPYLNKALGPVTSSRVAAIISLPVLACYPFMSNLSGFVLKLLITCASFVKNVLSITIITGLNILQNNAVPQNQRALANGISVTGMSIFKAVAPAVGGTLLSWAQKRKASFLPGCLLGLILTFKPFLALPRRTA
ncbi:probable peptide/nitrate transporter At3g43790 isoform X2 [Phalaenopsis equestris]|uniref:probable peptide/nitrate transporter At3g43790 isoform X2 n=1 Tax=Phalaenopsis equestris TaxID=78828 RepID=UPI0009E553EC|nr:probable peptide/nitrate transporter At3g43790 isoform X2 [Phalaenopsis equestris]